MTTAKYPSQHGIEGETRKGSPQSPPQMDRKCHGKQALKGLTLGKDGGLCIYWDYFDVLARWTDGVEKIALSGTKGVCAVAADSQGMDGSRRASSV